MRNFTLILTAFFAALSLNVSTAQCYEIGFPSEPTFNPDPMDLVEFGGTTTMTVEFCNEESIVPNDPNGNTQMTLCGAKLFPTTAPTGTYAGNFTWFQFDACWIGVIPAGSITPAGCGTIEVEWEATANTSEELPENCVNINVQPAGIIAGSDCFDPEDDAVSGCTFTQQPQGLPVELVSFQAEKKGSESMLSWKTASEINNSHFEIERSDDGRSFEFIGEIDGRGTTTSLEAYEFVDATPLKGVNYYRLKQVDYNGDYEYTDIRTVEFAISANDSRVTLYPNPVTDFVRVNTQETNLVLEAFDLNGKLVYKRNVSESGEVNTQDFIGGAYIFKVSSTAGKVILTEKIIVSK